MKIYISKLGAQYFLILEDLYALPINKITDMDLHANDLVSKNNVCIRIGSIEYLFKYEQADSIRQFLSENQFFNSQDLLPKSGYDYRLDKF